MSLTKNLQIRKIDGKKEDNKTSSSLSHYNILFGLKIAPQQKHPFYRTESNKLNFNCK